ncbi:GT2-family glycosyltransferase [Chara braunii]|uniref:glucomannan 4-beta-mannosyltransferase n=1 Tax=Chara braunii TaxID=69332 RepID=A0A388M9Q9_CHABU|nr:GT2-family glycosyltransferase [Chara braunii]|eukprot:GBG91311.1 GT2-family glycosyltransferase [Chara braunii]
MALYNKSSVLGDYDDKSRGGLLGYPPAHKEKQRSLRLLGGRLLRSFLPRWLVMSIVDRSFRSNSMGKTGTKPPPSKRSPLQAFTFGICILFLVMLLLSYSDAPAVAGVLEVMTYPFTRVAEVFAVLTEAFTSFRGRYIAPGLQAVINVLIIVFAVQSMDTLLMSLISFYFSFTGWRAKKVTPLPPYRPSKDSSGNLTSKTDAYPRVLIQIPMFNERECYQISIGACSQLDWPRDKLIIQVLDDSNNEEIKEMVKEEVGKWQSRGVNIDYRHRVDRTGYKGGSLKQGMLAPYVKDCEFVAVFDADFQPRPDWLLQTVPYFKDDPKLALVQTRWEYSNHFTNLLTRFQFINMSYHFEVEQQVMGATMGFFGFNGTGGIWRITAVNDAGGWDVRTTVEDMDIAVRAHICGYHFNFCNHIRVPCELPQTLEAYTRQQHRWHAGPMNLFRILAGKIVRTPSLTFFQKFHLIVVFFFVRRLLVPTVNFLLFVVLLPLSLFVPEATIPIWVTYTFPMFLSIFRMCLCPSLFPYMFPYLFFENTMVLIKLSANIQGLLNFGRVNEWIVTAKVGALAKVKDETANKPKKKGIKVFKRELFMSFFLLLAAIQSLAIEKGIHFYIFLFQGLSFFAFGMDLLSDYS